MIWYEHIIIEGGPEWTNEWTGRADLVLVRPVDTVTYYPARGAHQYSRTNRGWVSPLYGTVHTVFEYIC